MVLFQEYIYSIVSTHCNVKAEHLMQNQVLYQQSYLIRSSTQTERKQWYYHQENIDTPEQLEKHKEKREQS